MTPRERLIRAIRKEEVDRLPFWPKLFNKPYFTAHELGEQIRDRMRVAEFLDCEVILPGLQCPYVLKRKKVSEETETTGNEEITIYRTPEGELRQVQEYVPGSYSWHPREYPLKDKEDFKKARYLFSEFHFELDHTILEKVRATLELLGEKGIGLFVDWRTPLMALLQDWIGLEKGIYFLADYRKEMEELMGLMHEVHKERTRLLAATDGFEFFTPIENTSTTLISPVIFRRYCQKELSEYAEIVKSRGKYYVLHMCGHLKDILADIDAIPADAIEALTTPPVGNTTLAEAKAGCPNKSLIGGTNAGLWLKSADEIVAGIEQAIAETGTIRGIVVSSGGEMPVACGLERVKEISATLKKMKWPG